MISILIILRFVSHNLSILRKKKNKNIILVLLKILEQTLNLC